MQIIAIRMPSTICGLARIEGQIQNKHVLSIQHIGRRSVGKEEAVDESSDLDREAQKRRNISRGLHRSTNNMAINFAYRGYAIEVQLRARQLTPSRLEWHGPPIGRANLGLALAWSISRYATMTPLLSSFNNQA
jgi:hypothetical protein